MARAGLVSGVGVAAIVRGWAPIVLLMVAATVAGCASGSNHGDSDQGSGGTPMGVGGSPPGESGGADSGSGGSETGTGGSDPGSTPTCLQASTTSFLDFEGYDGGELSFLVAGEDVGGVYAGPWELSDEGGDTPDPEPTYGIEMADGFGDSEFSLRVADDEAKAWGGGVGFWMTACVDAATYNGIRLQIRGTSPTGTVRMELATRDTTPPADGGVCMGASCSHAATDQIVLPQAAEEWVQVSLPWSSFTGGAGTDGIPVSISGFGITGFVFVVNVQFDEEGPLPAPYEIVLDDIGFY